MPSRPRDPRGDNIHELFGAPEITIDPWLVTPRILHASRKKHATAIMRAVTLAQSAHDLIMYGSYDLSPLQESHRLGVISLQQLGFSGLCPWETLAFAESTFRARYRFRLCPPGIVLAACAQAPDVPHGDSALFYMRAIESDEDAPPRVLRISQTLGRIVVSVADADEGSPLAPSQRLIVTLL